MARRVANLETLGDTQGTNAMSSYLYKYLGSSHLSKVLCRPGGTTLKCSYPKDFNDPYELFLTIDFTDSPEGLAYYAEAIGDMPQIPTTCFSRSPCVLPMWAHYAENLSGFVLGLDEAKLAAVFPEGGFGDVDYQDKPDSSLNELLGNAYIIKKPRYTYMLQRAVFSAAYYTKATCWAYEQERRMLVPEAETRLSEGLLLLDVPKECVAAIFSGPRASAETEDLLRRKADELGCGYFKMAIGRSSAVPYFLGAEGYAHTFVDGRVEAAECSCSTCGEPMAEDVGTCSWCLITEELADDAARSNPFRLLSQLGMLDSYVEDMNGLSRGRGGGDSEP